MEVLNKILGVVDVIHEILLGGGEIFLYPHMNEIIEYCIQSNKIRNVVIVTNGTVLPSEDTLKLLKNKFDLKGLEEISSHREYYYDGEHLNRYGAEQFTKYFLEHCMKNVE